MVKEVTSSNKMNISSTNNEIHCSVIWISDVVTYFTDSALMIEVKVVDEIYILQMVSSMLTNSVPNYNSKIITGEHFETAVSFFDVRCGAKKNNRSKQPSVRN